MGQPQIKARDQRFLHQSDWTNDHAGTSGLLFSDLHWVTQQNVDASLAACRLLWAPYNLISMQQQKCQSLKSRLCNPNDQDCTETEKKARQQSSCSLAHILVHNLTGCLTSCLNCRKDDSLGKLIDEGALGVIKRAVGFRVQGRHQKGRPVPKLHA